MTTNTAGNLSARAVLVSLNIRTWSGCRQDKTIVQAASDKTSASKSALRGSKYIVPPSDLKPINTIASYLRTEHYRLTLPWIEEGWRMLEVAAFPRHRKLVKDSESAFRDSLIENVRELVDVLPLLNITDDPAVNAVLAGLDSIGRVDPSDLRKDAALREQLAREAETLTSAMEAFA